MQKYEMLFFKECKTGSFCRGIGFLHLYKNKTWENIESILIDCGMSHREAKGEINNEKAIISLYSNIKTARENHLSYQQRSGKDSLFGDWISLDRDAFMDIFRHIYDAPIQRCSDYNVCIMRDESGIPSEAHIYSTNYRFLGTISFGTTKSKNTIQYDKSIDCLPWNLPRQILCQEIETASFANSLMQESSSTSVGFIVSSGSIPNYGNIQFPITYWLAKYDEEPTKITNFYNGENSIKTCRLQNKGAEPFVAMSSMSSIFLQNNSIEFCKDIVALASRNKVSGILDFVHKFMSSSSINKESKISMIKDYATRIGVDSSQAMMLIRKYGIGASTHTSNGCTYFVKDSKYHASKKDNVGEAVSNFYVQPDICYAIGNENVVCGTLTVEGKSARFSIDRDLLLKSKSCIKELSKIAEQNEMIIPTIYRYKDYAPINKLIFDAVSECTKSYLKKIGFDGYSYISSCWSVSESIVLFHEDENKQIQEDFSFSYIDKQKTNNYENIAMHDLHLLCKDENIKTLIFLLLKTINHKLTKGNGTLFVDEDTLLYCSSILGQKITKELKINSQLQISYSGYSSRFVEKNGITSIMIKKQIIGSPKNTFTFTGSINNKIEPSVPLLPMLIKLAISNIPTKIMQSICNTKHFDEINRANKIYSLFSIGEAKVFIDSVKTLNLKDKYIHKDFTGNTTIEIARCIKELKLSGIEINRSQVIEDLKNSGTRFIYPVRKFKDRSTCIVIYGLNDIVK